MSGILALIPVWQTPTVKSSSNYLFGTKGSSQISPLSSDLLWADWRAAEGNQDGAASLDHWSSRVQHFAIECLALLFCSWFIQTEVLIGSSKEQLLLYSTLSLLSSISQPPSFSLSSCLPAHLTRFFISDTLLYHLEQSLVSDREAGGLHRGCSEDRGGGPPVPQGFISCPDIMIFTFFPGEQTDFLLLDMVQSPTGAGWVSW